MYHLSSWRLMEAITFTIVPSYTLYYSTAYSRNNNPIVEFSRRNSVFSGSYKFSSTFGAPLWESNFTSNPYSMLWMPIAQMWVICTVQSKNICWIFKTQCMNELWKMLAVFHFIRATLQKFVTSRRGTIIKLFPAIQFDFSQSILS